MQRILPLLAAALVVGAPGSALAQAGRVQFVTGEVKVQRAAGTRVAAIKGLAIEEGDTVVTGADGQAQLKMVDDGLIAVRSNTEIKLEAYRYAGREDGSERGLIGLLRGAFRSITGAIGRGNKDSYRIRTPNSTIGIRGTDHETAFVPPPAAGEVPAVEPGTYNKVNTGETFIETNGRRIELSAHQAGFAGLAGNAVPVRLPEIPAFLRGGSRGGDLRRPGGPREAGPRLGPRPGGPGPGLPPPPPGAAPPPDAGTFDPRQLPPGIAAAPFGTALVGGDLSPTIMGSGAGVVGVDIYAVVDAAGRMVQTGSPNFNYARNGAPLVDAGGAVVDGAPVNWGIYAGGEIKDGMGVRLPKFFHHMIATNTTTAAQLLALPTGTITLSAVGGYTKPIADTGAVGGTVNAVSLTINHGAGFDVTGYTISVTDGHSRLWSGSQSGSVSLSEFARGTGIPLSVSCSGCDVGGGTGTAHGIPIGSWASAPQRAAISSYDLHAGTAGVTGSVLIK